MASRRTCVAGPKKSETEHRNAVQILLNRDGLSFNIIYSGAYLDRQFDDSGGHGRISYLHLLLSPE